MISVIINGKRYQAEPQRLLANYEARVRENPLAKPYFMLACQVCNELCAIGVDCRCCHNVGKYFGGKRVRTSSGHDRIPIDEALAALRDASVLTADV